MQYNETVFWNSYDEKIGAKSAGGYLIAIGDSWFSYPFKGGSLINRIGDLLTGGRTIRVEATPGAEVGDFVDGKLRHKARQLLQFYAPGADGLLLSGGGNEFAGTSDLLPLLKPNCSKAESPRDCFKEGDSNEEGTVNWLMADTLENYMILVSRAFDRLPSHAKVFVHTYDYAFPTGKGVFGGEGWILPSLKAAQVPPNHWRGCIRYLIDGFADALKSLQDRWPDRVVIVNSRGTLQTEQEWHNELHPSPEGFKRIAHERWLPLLKKSGFA